MINTDNIEEARKLIKKSGKPIIVKARNLEFNRKILEYGKFDILLDIEESSGKNKLRQIDSGFNEVLAAIARKNNISIGIDLKKINQLSKEKKAEYLTKLKQNIKICRKFETNMVILNVEDKNLAKAFLTSLGASSQQISKALYF